MVLVIDIGACRSVWVILSASVKSMQVSIGMSIGVCVVGHVRKL